MAWDPTDWTIDRATGDIRYTGDDHGGASPTYVTVIDFHRELQDFADDASSAGDDELAITDLDPSSRSTDNIITLKNNYNIDATASEHLYDGSIIQDDGDTIYDGIVNFGNATVQIQILQDGEILSDDWWNEGGGGLNADAGAGISHRFMLPVRLNGVDIDDRKLIGTSRTFNNTYSEFSINGSSRGNNVLALNDATDLNNATAVGTVAGWTGITNGNEGYTLIDVDNDATDEAYWSNWNTNQPTRSINEFYERMKWLTRDGSASTIYGMNGERMRGITHQFDYDNEVSGGLAEAEEAVWGTFFAYDNEASGPFTVGEYLTFSGSGARGKLLYLDDQGTTGNMVVWEISGTIADGNTLTGVDSGATADVNGAPTDGGVQGGRAQVLAIDDNGTSGTIWWQLLSGSNPADNQVVYRLSDNADQIDVDGSFTSRTISTPFCGASTGSAIIGSYGFGIEAPDLTQNDIMTALDNVTYSPPNIPTFTVAGLVSGQDRVLVGPWDGVSTDPEGNPAIDKDQLTLNTTLNGAAETSIVTTASIPLDTPASGTIRVELDDGNERLQSYTSYSGSTFTIPSTDYSGGNVATANNDVWVSYIDELASGTTASFSGVYQSDRDLVVLARDGGGTPIKQFISSGVFGSSNTTITIIRTSDT